MHTSAPDPSTADVIVVGGSYAGLSAALQLARARRRVTIVDAGQRRNRFATHSHGFLAQDGMPPERIAAIAREQVRAYPNVRWIDGHATAARQRPDGSFVVEANDLTLHADRVVLATGVVDELPPIDGLSERWGRSVFHCPYCHGYELHEGAIGVLATGPVAQHHALMLPDWGPTTLLLNDAWVPDAELRQSLAARGVAIEPVPVRRITGRATVELADGRTLAFAGLFTQSRTRPASPLASQLGCAFNEGPTGPYVQVDALMQTSVPRVFACGDAARAAGNVALAVGDGAMTGASVHRSMMFG
jgi:thioredoxin reductase